MAENGELKNHEEFTLRWGRFLYIFAGGFILGVSSILIGMFESVFEGYAEFGRYFIYNLIIAIISGFRLSDINISGWFAILAFVPYLNLALIVILVFFPGTKGKNKYGYTWNRENQEKYGIIDESSDK